MIETKAINNKKFVSNKNGDIFIMSPTKDHTYRIIKVNKNVEGVFKPTFDEKRKALINYLLEDNYTNPCKQGLHNLSKEDIQREYNEYYIGAVIDGVFTKDFFDCFALSPKGDKNNSAVNGLVADVLKEIKCDDQEIDYVNRCWSNKSPEQLLDKLELMGGKTLCMTYENRKKCEFDIYEYQIENGQICSGELVLNPDAHQKQNALLNLIITDNEINPSKTGIYHIDEKEIVNTYNNCVLPFVGNQHVLSVSGIMEKFGMHYDDEEKQEMLRALVEDVVDDILELVHIL